MNISKSAFLAMIVFLLAFSTPDQFQLNASESTSDNVPPTESGKLYLPSNDAMADVTATLERAKQNGKLALVILGANWCHDSQALASRINKEPLKSLVESEFETVYVSVGYFTEGRDVISSIGPPVYYATPTVLIVDPVSGVLVNANNRHQWGGADSISMVDSVDYFQLMASTDRSSSAAEDQFDEELRLLLDEIAVFELAQAERLYEAYAVLGPLLEAYDQGEESESFDAYWVEVREFRSSVATDVDALKLDAGNRVANGEVEISLSYPQYPAFSWETD